MSEHACVNVEERWADERSHKRLIHLTRKNQIHKSNQSRSDDKKEDITV